MLRQLITKRKRATVSMDVFRRERIEKKSAGPGNKKRTASARIIRLLVK